MAQILTFPEYTPPPPKIACNCLPSILASMSLLESKAETRRLLKVLVTGLYISEVINQREWAQLSTTLESIPYRKLS